MYYVYMTDNSMTTYLTTAMNDSSSDWTTAIGKALLNGVTVTVGDEVVSRAWTCDKCGDMHEEQYPRSTENYCLRDFQELWQALASQSLSPEP